MKSYTKMVIYKITNLLNGKIYIGKTVRDRHGYYGSGIYIKKAIAKYGKGSFKKEILESCYSLLELKTRERFWIENINSRIPKGYNITAGGDDGVGGPYFKGHKHTEETKEKLRKNWDYEKMITPERNKKISESKKGIPRSNETKEKLSKYWVGKTFIDRFGKEKAKEIIDKIVSKQTGQRRPKQSIAMKGRFVGEKNPMYGKTHSSEFKQRRREYFLSDKNPGKHKTEATKEKIAASKRGKPGAKHTKEYKEYMSNKMTQIWKERKSGKK